MVASLAAVTMAHAEAFSHGVGDVGRLRNNTDNACTKRSFVFHNNTIVEDGRGHLSRIVHVFKDRGFQTHKFLALSEDTQGEARRTKNKKW